MQKIIPFLFTCFCSIQGVPAQAPPASVITKKAPSVFKAVFTTTKGDFTIEAHRDWSPLGVDRLYQLIISGYFDNTFFFRVEPKYVTQFGVADTHAEKRFWDRKRIKDETPKQKHTKGTIAFARDEKDSRCTQLFINMADNPKLDTVVREGVKGYPPVARITKGMDIVSKLNGEYGKKPAVILDSLYKYGNRYFEMLFPRLDKIIRAQIVY